MQCNGAAPVCGCRMCVRGRWTAFVYILDRVVVSAWQVMLTELGLQSREWVSASRALLQYNARTAGQVTNHGVRGVRELMQNAQGTQ